LRIARHPFKRERGHELQAVTWSGGHKWFPCVLVSRQEDPDFRATFAYYGGALMQAELTFVDGTSCVTHVYVPLLTGQSGETHPGSTAATSIKR
jgi:hypothetical protein